MYTIHSMVASIRRLQSSLATCESQRLVCARGCVGNEEEKGVTRVKLRSACIPEETGACFLITSHGSSVAGVVDSSDCGDGRKGRRSGLSISDPNGTLEWSTVD